MIDLNSPKNRNSLDVGILNKKITVQKRTQNSDGAGGFTSVAWSNMVTVWASVQTNKKQEVIAGRAQDVIAVTFTAQWRKEFDDDPKKKDIYRVVYNKRAYRVISLELVNENKFYISLICDGNDWESV